MKKTVLSKLVGKEVEVFLQPDMPVSTGVLLSCDDDFVVMEDGIWSYQAILGIRAARPLPDLTSHLAGRAGHDNQNSDSNSNTVSNETVDEIETQPVQHKESKPTSTTTPTAEIIKSDNVETKAVDNTATDKVAETEGKKKQQETIKVPDREFAGVLTTFYYDHRRWGFIESPEVLKAGVPLRDGSKVFVHLNQIIDNTLRKWLLAEKPENPNVDVMFRLTVNQQGVAADDVRKVEHVKLGEAIILTAPNTASTSPIKSTSPATPETTTQPTQTAKTGTVQTATTPEGEKAATSATPDEAKSTDEKTEAAEENATPDENKNAGDKVAVEEREAQEADNEAPTPEVGEIDYYRRYEAIPHGIIRMKGNKLFRFDDIDVIDPILAVFLEVSPNAEGQAVKFIKKMMPNSILKATNVEAAVPFPEEKVKDWEKSGLIQKAKERLKSTATDTAAKSAAPAASGASPAAKGAGKTATKKK